MARDSSPALQPGQLLFVGFQGTQAPEVLLDCVRAGRIGGVVLFKRNLETPAQVRALIASLQAAAPAAAPLLVAIDQEGGRVQRLRDPWTEWPSMRRVAERGDPAATAETDLGSVIRVLRAQSIYLATSRPGTESSYERLRARFRDSLFDYHSRQLVAAIVFDTSCRTLIEACAGAFHLSPHPPYKPIKVHPFKDVVDALRYGNDNLQPMNVQFQQAMRQLATNDCVWL